CSSKMSLPLASSSGSSTEEEDFKAKSASVAIGVNGDDANRWATSRRQSASSLTAPRSAESRRVLPLAAAGVGFNDMESVGSNQQQQKHQRQQRQQQKQQSTYQCPAVVPLNVGGVSYITRRSTLLKEPDSMLAAMFSGRHEMQRDRHGYYFIDTNGVYFGYILDYLRHGKLPPNEAALPVYQEAGYFGLAGLQEALAVTPAVAKEIVRQRHEEQFGDYADLRARVIAAAIEVGAVTRCADLLIWPHRLQATPQHASCVAETAHVKFGPWPGAADEETLMRSLHSDLSDAGYSLAPLEKKRCKFFVSGQTCTRLAYKLSLRFT
ncbi:hypothetical protein BOX15_Mlig033325g2, partial [Macrostomum lignano]